MKKILIVDDEKEIREILKKKLDKSGYGAMTASSGEEALIICRTSLPDLVLLDIAMPNMDGYSVAVELKKDKITREIPLIFLTAKELHPGSIDKRIAEFGSCDFIMKPCSFDDLKGKIIKFIG